MTSTAPAAALSLDTVDLGYFTFYEPLDDKTEAIVTINDKHMLVFTRMGSRSYGFTVETFVLPEQLAHALDFRFEAVEATREQVEEVVADMARFSTRTYGKDLELAFADLNHRGFTS